MTWTACPHCNKCTFAYSDSCAHCNKPLGDGMRILYGTGGKPLERFICRTCQNINAPSDSVCRTCGSALSP